jgi:hypothetical protein
MNFIAGGACTSCCLLTPSFPLILRGMKGGYCHAALNWIQGISASQLNFGILKQPMKQVQGKVQNDRQEGFQTDPRQGGDKSWNDRIRKVAKEGHKSSLWKREGRRDLINLMLINMSGCRPSPEGYRRTLSVFVCNAWRKRVQIGYY